jgi:UDP-N-acetylglucosamine acyltransferase
MLENKDMPISDSNLIHPTAIIEPGVVLGSGNVIGPFAQIFRNTVMGDDNYIGAGVIIGAYPEHRSVNHLDKSSFLELPGVHIGSRVVIREYAQIHQGLEKTTRIGNEAFIMNQTYIAHDCEVASGAVLASSVLLAGNVSIGIQANLGMGAKVHQGVSIGRLSMIGMGSVVTRSIPDFMKVYGVPARIHGANEIGMERAGMSIVEIEAAKRVAAKD